MNEVNQTSKTRTMKTMAVIGFVALLIFTIWLAVVIVRVIPDAFSSLASIADGVYNNRPAETLTVSSNETIVNVNESLTISWTTTNQEGAYSFSYECVDGVSVDVRNQTGATVPVDCNSPVNVGSNVNELTVQATSEKRRFTDVNYTIAFTPTDPAAEAMQRTDSFTIVNASIPQSSDLATGDDTESDPEPEPAPEPEPTPNDTGAPTVIETPIYAIPDSDPDGFADLEVTFLGVGTLDNNNRFSRTATLDNDTRGAFQFAVRNIGTKTSTEWEFEATLTSGNDFAADDQDPLKPNERAIITLGFDAVGETGFQKFGARIDGGGERNEENNSFTWAVEVTN